MNTEDESLGIAVQKLTVTADNKAIWGDKLTVAPHSETVVNEIVEARNEGREAEVFVPYMSCNVVNTIVRQMRYEVVGKPLCTLRIRMSMIREPIHEQA